MKLDKISSPIDSLESKWWYRLPDRIPAASAISRTVVARNPFCANNSPASRTTSARRRPAGPPPPAPAGPVRPAGAAPARLFFGGARTETVIEQHWTAMSKYDPKHHIKLIVDEWGVWYRPGEELAPAYQLSQPLTLRDALHTAVTLDVFNRQADKIAMANVAQTIKCIHSLMLAQGDRYARTPVYYVFEMYRNHMRSRVAPMTIRCDELKVPS